MNIMFPFQLESYKEAQDFAKKSHSNIWEYGDITEDDAKEFGLGKCKYLEHMFHYTEIVIVLIL